MTECERIIQKGILPESFFVSEEQYGFWVDENRKKIWAVEIDLLLELDRVCKKYNLKYFLIFGSLLGAVRHKGFIPWDDDLDVAMLRQDYECLLQLKDEFKAPYFFQTPYTDTGYFYAHAKLRNSNTTALDKPFLYQKFNLGMFIDIVPIDNIVKDGGQETFQLIHKLIMDNSTYMRLTNPHLSERDQKRVENYMGDEPFATYEKIQQLARKYENEETEFVSILTAPLYGYEKDVFYMEDFKEPIECKCEFFSSFIPNGYERILKTIYGDYMQLPPREQRGNWHGNIVFNADVSYEKCLKEIMENNYVMEKM